jgi:hypothetical protein
MVRAPTHSQESNTDHALIAVKMNTCIRQVSGSHFGRNKSFRRVGTAVTKSDYSYNHIRLTGDIEQHDPHRGHFL